MFLRYEHCLVEALHSFEIDIGRKPVANAVRWRIKLDRRAFHLARGRSDLHVVADSRRARGEVYDQVFAFGVTVVAAFAYFESDLFHCFWEVLIEVGELNEIEVAGPIN